MQNLDIAITMPEMNSSRYKLITRQIEQSVKKLNGFTINLEQKLAKILKGQETEFVNSYKTHMCKIEKTLQQFQAKIYQYKKKIDQYQKDGMLANLIKKTTILEKQEKKLFIHLENKDNTIRMLKCEISLQNKQIKSLQAKIKQLYQNNVSVQKSSKNFELSQNVEQPHTFATQISPIFPKKKQKMNKNKNLRTLDRSVQALSQLQILRNPQQKDKRIVEQDLKYHRLERQLGILKKKNRQLSSVNTKIMDKTNSIQRFFLKTVDEVKKKINNRKKIADCGLQDFKQQDKLELLVKVLSNDEILGCLYDKIFGKKTIYKLYASDLSSLDNDVDNLKVIQKLREPSGSRKLILNERKFPSIWSQRRE